MAIHKHWWSLFTCFYDLENVIQVWQIVYINRASFCIGLKELGQKAFKIGFVKTNCKLKDIFAFAEWKIIEGINYIIWVDL